MKLRLLGFTTFAALLATAIAVSAAPATRSTQVANPLRVAMFASQGSVDSFLGAVEVRVTNISGRTVRVPKWQLPSAYLDSNLFKLSRNGEPVPYVGRLVKRALPRAEDFVVIRAGDTYRTVVDLSAAYDLDQSGQYVVTYAIPLQFASLSNGAMLKTAAGAPLLLQSAPMQLHVDVGAAAPKRVRDLIGSPTISTAPAGAKAVRGTIGNPPLGGTATDARCLPGIRGCAPAVQATYIGCTVERQELLKQSITAARAYTENAKNYLNAGTQGERYTWWFGAYAAARYSAAKQNYIAIDTAMDMNAGQISINCGCNEDHYAHVFPNDPYKIYVCNYFWAAPMTGTDSKAGTLIHEMSHFYAVADTDDWVYGQTGAHALAGSNPNRTSGNYSLNPVVFGNADSHEYFGENTPAQN